jgi:Choline/Carnitine o-acyltransferase
MCVCVCVCVLYSVSSTALASLLASVLTRTHSLTLPTCFFFSAWLDLQEQITEEKLEPGMVGGVIPVDMSGFRLVFGSCRRPHHTDDCDEFVRFEQDLPKRHVVVVCKGHFFSFPLHHDCMCLCACVRVCGCVCVCVWVGVGGCQMCYLSTQRNRPHDGVCSSYPKI